MLQSLLTEVPVRRLAPAGMATVLVAGVLIGGVRLAAAAPGRGGLVLGREPVAPIPSVDQLPARLPGAVPAETVVPSTPVVDGMTPGMNWPGAANTGARATTPPDEALVSPRGQREPVAVPRPDPTRRNRTLARPSGPGQGLGLGRRKK